MTMLRTGWMMGLMLLACHGRETDEVIAGLRSDNERLRSENGALRDENIVLVEAVDARWPKTVSLKRAGGNSARNMYRRECPDGQALKGFQARSGSVIDALVPVCTPLASLPGTFGTRTLERELASVGGRGGRPSEVMCSSNGVMIGMRGRSAEVVDALEPVCDRGSAARVGGPGGRDYERMCPTGWVAVGITGRQGDYLEAVSLTCADPGDARPMALTPPTPEVPAPETPTPEAPRPAPARKVAPGDDAVPPVDAAPPTNGTVF